MKGFKTGGRKAGTRNKTNAAREAAVRASGLAPLEYMLATLRNPKQPVNIRLDAAKAAAQYVHPKLSAVTLKGDPSHPLQSVEMTPQEFEKIARRLLAEV